MPGKLAASTLQVQVQGHGHGKCLKKFHTDPDLRGPCPPYA